MLPAARPVVAEADLTAFAAEDLTACWFLEERDTVSWYFVETDGQDYAEDGC